MEYKPALKLPTMVNDSIDGMRHDICKYRPQEM